MNKVQTLIAKSPAGDITIPEGASPEEASYLMVRGYTLHRTSWKGETWGVGKPSKAYAEGQWRGGAWLPDNSGM